MNTVIAQDQLLWTTKIKQDDLYGGESKGRPLGVCWIVTPFTSRIELRLRRIRYHTFFAFIVVLENIFLKIRENSNAARWETACEFSKGDNNPSQRVLKHFLKQAQRKCYVTLESANIRPCRTAFTQQLRGQANCAHKIQFHQSTNKQINAIAQTITVFTDKNIF